jgi:hypothetical protein
MAPTPSTPSVPYVGNNPPSLWSSAAAALERISTYDRADYVSSVLSKTSIASPTPDVNENPSLKDATLLTIDLSPSYIDQNSQVSDLTTREPYEGNSIASEASTLHSDACSELGDSSQLIPVVFHPVCAHAKAALESAANGKPVTVSLDTGSLEKRKGGGGKGGGKNGKTKPKDNKKEGEKPRPKTNWFQDRAKNKDIESLVVVGLAIAAATGIVGFVVFVLAREACREIGRSAKKLKVRCASCHWTARGSQGDAHSEHLEEYDVELGEVQPSCRLIAFRRATDGRTAANTSSSYAVREPPQAHLP